MSYELIDTEAITLDGATVYEDQVVGIGGIDRLYVGTGDSALRTLVNDAGEVVAQGGAMYDTVVNSGGKMSILGYEGASGYAYDTVVNVGTLNVSEGGVVHDTIINSGGTLTLIGEGAVAYDTVINKGVMALNSGSYAYDTTVYSGSSQRVNPNGSVHNTTIYSGGTMLLYSSTKLSGDIDVSGRVRLVMTAGITGSGCNFNMILAGRTATASAFTDKSVEFITGAAYIVTVSNTQADGVYKLCQATTAFSSSITIQNALGESLGTVTLNNSLSTGYGTYSLSIVSKVLSLTVATITGSTSWPASWYSAPRTAVAQSGSSNSLNIVSDTYKADGVYGVEATGGKFEAVTATGSQLDAFVKVSGGTVKSIEGGSANNYVYLNGSDAAVKSLCGSVGDSKSFTLQVDDGKLASLVAAVVDGAISGAVNMTISSGDAVHTGNIIGGASAMSSTLVSSVAGRISLNFTEALFSGLVFAAGRSVNGAAAKAENTVTVNVDNSTHSANSKLLSSGFTNWIIGGGAAVEGTAAAGSVMTVGGDVTINIANSTVGYVTAGGMASGAASISTVKNSTINISGETTITGDIYGGGYAVGEGISTVASSSINIKVTTGSVISILGGIYAGAANPLKTGTGVVSNCVITFSGDGDYLSFTGRIDGVGNTGNTVEAQTLLFKSYKGEFAGKISNFGVISFSEDSVVELNNGETATADTFVFDCQNRSSSLYSTAFANDAFAIDKNSTVLDIYMTSTAIPELALMEVSEDVEGCAVLIEREGSTYETTFGSTLTITNVGTFSTYTRDGVAYVSFVK